jgi:Transposase/zinc-finger of transposase IS204/IS1001/IS1096/IS1165
VLAPEERPLLLVVDLTGGPQDAAFVAFCERVIGLIAEAPPRVALVMTGAQREYLLLKYATESRVHVEVVRAPSAGEAKARALAGDAVLSDNYIGSSALRVEAVARPRPRPKLCRSALSRNASSGAGAALNTMEPHPLVVPLSILFAFGEDVVVQHLTVGTSAVHAHARVAGDHARCPTCQTRSDRVHGSYVRTLADLAWQAKPVCLRLRVRRFVCDAARCPRRTFTEPLPSLAVPHARRTRRLTQQVVRVGIALGGQAGARLLPALGVEVSADTVLRAVRRVPAPTGATPRVLGVDEWALRKGHSYGTLLVDLERSVPVGLLPERSADSFAAWLEEHPGVEVITRDRSETYAEGARRSAPDAVQVADRWHLLKNVGEAVERVLHRHRGAPSAQSQAACPSPTRRPLRRRRRTHRKPRRPSRRPRRAPRVGCLARPGTSTSKRGIVRVPVCSPMGPPVSQGHGTSEGRTNRPRVQYSETPAASRASEALRTTERRRAFAGSWDHPAARAHSESARAGRVSVVARGGACGASESAAPTTWSSPRARASVAGGTTRRRSRSRTPCS